MMETILYQAMNVFIILSCLLGFYGIVKTLHSRCYMAAPRWLLALLGVMFLYFAIFYTYVVIAPSNTVQQNSVWVGRTFVRPANVVLFATVSALIYFFSCARKPK